MEVRSGSLLVLFLGGVWEAGSSCAVVMVELLGGRRGTTYVLFRGHVGNTYVIKSKLQQRSLPTSQSATI
jgi:hypothetical protein